MNEQGDEWHTMNPPIEEAVEIPYDPSKKGPGTLTIEVKFDRAEINRLKKGIPRGPIGVTRFIKDAALKEADRRAKGKRTPVIAIASGSRTVSRRNKGNPLKKPRYLRRTTSKIG